MADAPALLSPPARVLVVDIGGTNVKLRASHWDAAVKIPSGKAMGPKEMVAAVLAAVEGQPYDAVALGYPGPMTDGQPVQDPHNLAPGWVHFDFATAFSAPVRALNDAAMQALGNYKGGRMLFLGFGTGLGAALILDGLVQPLELAHLPYQKGKTYEDYVGTRGRMRLGERRWRTECLAVARLWRHAFQLHDLVLGGGNAKRLGRLPEGMRVGTRDAAFRGGLALWGMQAAPGAPAPRQGAAR